MNQEPLMAEGGDISHSVKEPEEKVRNALRGTSNRSAPGPDGIGISYRFIKMVLDTRLGREVITEVATTLKEGRNGSYPRWCLSLSRTRTTGQQKDGDPLISKTASATSRRKSLRMSCRKLGYSTRASRGVSRGGRHWRP